MKRNFFGEPIAQPGDDLVAMFTDHFIADVDLQLTARFIEDDEVCGWSCTVSDEEGNEMQVHDFESEGELRSYLSDQDIEIED